MRFKWINAYKELRIWHITSAQIHYTPNDSHHLKIDLHFLRLLNSALPHSSGDDHKGSPHRQKSSSYPTWLPSSASTQLASSSFMRPSPSRLGGRFFSVFLSNSPSCRGQWVLPTADSLLHQLPAQAYLVIVLHLLPTVVNYCHMWVSRVENSIYFSFGGQQ